MNMLKHIKLAVTLGAIASLPLACATEEDGDNGGAGCQGAKCDTPTGTDEQCLKRQAEVLNSSQRGFTPTDIRWACADVEGVNTVGRDDRGQEYCEYFAIIQPPGAEGEERKAWDVGRNLGGGGTTEPAICLDGENKDNCRFSLTEDQQFDMEDTPDGVAGVCVFTSWHADVKDDIPRTEENQIFGFPFTAEHFRMKVSFNSNRAAADLVEKCASLGQLQEQNPGKEFIRECDWENGSPDDDCREPFFRGCVGANGLFGTGWRRSDPSVCAVSNRLVECGCGVPGVENAKQLGDAVVPPQPRDGQDGEVTKRGFELATWDDREGLAPGCRYLELGDGSQALVGCDVTNADLLANRADIKEFCRATYGNNVVVHVPLPGEAISCTAPDTPEAASCGKVAWNIGQEGTVDPDPGESDSDSEGESDSDSAGESDTAGGGDNNCRTARNETGCDNKCIEECVCAQDEWCCNNEYDDICVGEVESFKCGEACGA